MTNLNAVNTNANTITKSVCTPEAKRVLATNDMSIILVRRKSDRVESYVNSVEVAKLVGKKHFNLVRSIDKFVEMFREIGYAPEDYFLAWETPRGGASYFITELGCEFLAENLKSEDYVNLFDEILVKHFVLREAVIAKEAEKEYVRFRRLEDVAALPKDMDENDRALQYFKKRKALEKTRISV